MPQGCGPATLVLWSRPRETPGCGWGGTWGERAEDHDRTATAHPPAQAAGRRDTPDRDQLVPAAPGRREQVRQDDTHLHRGGAVVRRRPPAAAGQPGHLGAGRQPRHPAVDGAAARPVQQRLRQQPVPRLAAVLQMAGRRRRAARPDGRAAAPAGPAAADPGLHQPGTGQARPGMRRPDVRPAPRHRDHRGVQGDRHPAVRAGRPPPPPRSTPPAATSTCGSGRSPSAARAASPGSSGSATRQPAASTGTCGPAPGTPRPGGTSCGSGPATGSR